MARRPSHPLDRISAATTRTPPTRPPAAGSPAPGSTKPAHPDPRPDPPPRPPALTSCRPHPPALTPARQSVSPGAAVNEVPTGNRLQHEQTRPFGLWGPRPPIDGGGGPHTPPACRDPDVVVTCVANGSNERALHRCQRTWTPSLPVSPAHPAPVVPLDAA